MVAKLCEMVRSDKILTIRGTSCEIYDWNISCKTVLIVCLRTKCALSKFVARLLTEVLKQYAEKPLNPLCIVRRGRHRRYLELQLRKYSSLFLDAGSSTLQTHSLCQQIRLYCLALACSALVIQLLFAFDALIVFHSDSLTFDSFHNGTRDT